MSASKRHFRICALQNNFRSDEAAARVIDTWAEIGFDTEQFFHICADAVSSLYNPKLHHEAVTQYLAKADKYGVGILFYMNCHIMNPSENDMSPDWATYKADGSYNVLYGSYHGTCLRSAWKEHFFESVRALKEFKLTGLFFDGPIWGVKCACPTCRREFQEKYGKPFDEGTEDEHMEFDRWTVDTFKRELREVVKSTNPEWLMYFNEGLMAGRFDADMMRRQIGYNDLVGTEHGGFYGHNPNNEQTRYWTVIEGAKIAKAVAGDKPSVIFFAGDHKPWSWSMHTPNETILTYFTILANGASVWYGLHNDPDYLQGEYGNALRKMVAYDKLNTSLYETMKSKAEVAIFQSFNTARYYPHTGIESDLYRDEDRMMFHPGNYSDSLRGTEGLLEHTSIPWDFVTELNLDALPQYKVVLAPTLAMADDETAQALEDYVKNGGVVIADGEFGFFDKAGKRRTTSLLEKFTGIIPSGKADKPGHFNYFRFDDKFYTADQTVRLLQLPEYLMEINPADAEIIAKACEIVSGPYVCKPGIPNIPFCLKKQLGKGYIIYFAGGIFEMYFNYRMKDYRKCFVNMMNSIFTPAYKLENSVPGISMTVSDSSEGTVIHLSNYVSAIWPIEKSVPVDGLLLKTPADFTQAKTLFAGVELKKNADGNWILPRLDICEAIVLK